MAHEDCKLKPLHALHIAMQQLQKGRPSPICCTCMFSRYLMGSYIRLPFCRQQGGLHLSGLIMNADIVQ